MVTHLMFDGHLGVRSSENKIRSTEYLVCKNKRRRVTVRSILYAEETLSIAFTAFLQHPHPRSTCRHAPLGLPFFVFYLSCFVHVKPIPCNDASQLFCGRPTPTATSTIAVCTLWAPTSVVSMFIAHPSLLMISHRGTFYSWIDVLTRTVHFQCAVGHAVKRTTYLSQRSINSFGRPFEETKILKIIEQSTMGLLKGKTKTIQNKNLRIELYCSNGRSEKKISK